MKNLHSYNFNVILRPEPEGGFTVTVPTLPGCITYGRDLDEAKTMAKDAISAYIISLKGERDTRCPEYRHQKSPPPAGGSGTF